MQAFHQQHIQQAQSNEMQKMSSFQEQLMSCHAFLAQCTMQDGIISYMAAKWVPSSTAYSARAPTISDAEFLLVERNMECLTLLEGVRATCNAVKSSSVQFVMWWIF